MSLAMPRPPHFRSYSSPSQRSERQRQTAISLAVAWSILWPHELDRDTHMRLNVWWGEVNATGTGAGADKEILQTPRSPHLLQQQQQYPFQHRASLSSLPPELWQHILSHLPLLSFWACRAVHPAWKAHIEATLLRLLLAHTWLILQVDTAPSFDFYGTCVPQARVSRDEEGRWIEYVLPEREGRGKGWRAALPSASVRPRLARDGHRLLVSGKTYGVQVSIAGYLGPPPRARRVRVEERTRTVGVDWKVLLGTMLGPETFGWGGDAMLEDVMHRPGANVSRSSTVVRG